MSCQCIEPILFGDLPLHGVYCAPRGQQRASVLLISPLFEEKRSAYRATLAGAHALANAGAAVLLPDLYATGNSAGSLSETVLDRWLEDIREAARWLRERAGGPLYLLGCRAGALLAVQVAESCSTERLILWQPVLNGRGYLAQLRTRRMVQEKMTGNEPVEVGKYEVEGQELSPQLYTELENLCLPAVPPAGELRLLQCSFNEKLLNDYEKLTAQWGAGRLRARCLLSEPFWTQHTPGAYTELTAALTEEVLS